LELGIKNLECCWLEVAHSKFQIPNS
jgi:hypothetical protein